MTKTQAVIAAMKVALIGAGLTVRDDTEELYSFESGPVIVLDAGDEYPDPASPIGVTYWSLAVQLVVGAEGAEPKMAPEPTRAAAHSALFADRTLGGAAVDILAGPISRSIDEENPGLGITRATYNLKYRTMEGQV